MTYELIGRTRLSAGESLHMAVGSGTTLHVTRGNVMLCEPPQWIAGRILMARTRLDEGGAHAVERAGWIEVVAQGDSGAEIVQYRQVGAAVELMQRAVRWVRGVVGERGLA